MAGRLYTITANLATAAYTTNIFRCPTGAASGVGVVTAEMWANIKRVKVINKGAGASTFRLYKGATGANASGTEFVGYDVSVAIGGTFVDYPNSRFEVADYLVGGASAAGLIIEVDVELNVL